MVKSRKGYVGLCCFNQWFTAGLLFVELCWNPKKPLREVSITNSDQVLVDWSIQWKLEGTWTDKPEQFTWNRLKQIQLKNGSWNISSTRTNGKRDEDTNHFHLCNEWFRKLRASKKLGTKVWWCFTTLVDIEIAGEKRTDWVFCSKYSAKVTGSMCE